MFFQNKIVEKRPTPLIFLTYLSFDREYFSFDPPMQRAAHAVRERAVIEEANAQRAADVSDALANQVSNGSKTHSQCWNESSIFHHNLAPETL